MKSTTLKETSAWISLLTTLAAMPYEKDVMGIIPPSIAPYVVYVGLVATLALRILGYKMENKETNEN